MERKKWTPKTEISDSLLKFREKRKWQLALRRYVIEFNKSAGYAIYYGLSIDQFRHWIEIQFTEELNWGNFASAWQFEHIIPVTYFDFSKDEDLMLCWNFLNIKVVKIELGKTTNKRIDLIMVKAYFELLYSTTGYSMCLKLIEKINSIQVSKIALDPIIISFITKNKETIETQATLTKAEFNLINTGVPLKDILLEKAIIKRFS